MPRRSPTTDFCSCAEDSAPVKSSAGRKQSPNGKPPAHNTMHQEKVTLRQTPKPPCAKVGLTAFPTCQSHTALSFARRALIP
jgi:hypothetical protein